MDKKKLISIIMPVFNEDKGLDNFYNQLKNVINKLDYNFEIIFVNDGSVDNSLDVPQNWDKLYVPDAEAIADAVIFIMNDWFRWSEQAQKRAKERFNKEIWLSKHRDIFHMLIMKT